MFQKIYSHFFCRSNFFNKFFLHYSIGFNDIGEFIFCVFFFLLLFFRLKMCDEMNKRKKKLEMKFTCGGKYENRRLDLWQCVCFTSTPVKHFH